MVERKPYLYFIYTVIDGKKTKSGQFRHDRNDLTTYEDDVPYTLGSNQFIELKEEAKDDV